MVVKQTYEEAVACLGANTEERLNIARAYDPLALVGNIRKVTSNPGTFPENTVKNREIFTEFRIYLEQIGMTRLTKDISEPLTDPKISLNPSLTQRYL